MLLLTLPDEPSLHAQRFIEILVVRMYTVRACVLPGKCPAHVAFDAVGANATYLIVTRSL
jgi:hypothetical protein